MQITDDQINEISVIAVTVTYNSSNFLRRQLEALALSTVQLYKIVVIDNYSNDEHREAILKLSKQYNNVLVVRQNENLGGAGGFEKGVEYAISNYPKNEWIWIMDDDAFPKQDCLEKLIKFKDMENVGCLAPMIYGVELGEYQYYHHKIATRFLNSHYAATTNINEQNECIKIEIDAFVGPLIKTKVIRNIGFPEGKLFIYGDDKEYTYRITRKYNMFLIRDAIINHRDDVTMDGKVNAKGLWKEYYHFRNDCLFIKKYSKNRCYCIIGELLLMKDAFRATLSTIKHNRYAKYRKLRIECIWRGVFAGIAGISGKVINPQDFIKDNNL